MKGKIIITIAKDMMLAVLSITPEEVIEITEETIKNALQKQGITAGIDESVIQIILKEQAYEKKYVIAKGKEAVSGTNGYYEYFFDIQKKEYKPQIKEDGTVDYSIHRQMVHAGDLLAKYHKSKQGYFGCTIFSSMIAPIPVKDLSKLYTNGVEEREGCYYATTDGEVSFNMNTISINNVLTINGSASNATGNIDFVGDVHIKGDVITGVHITAGGNVIVDGVVEGARIESEKDIVIQRGIFGKGIGNLTAKGSIISGFIVEAKAHADKDITANELCNSYVEAEHNVNATGKDGSIIGGKTIAGNSITANSVGNDSGVRTHLNMKDVNICIRENRAIIIRKELYSGTELAFDNVVYVGNKIPGEYHKAYGSIKRYEIGDFEWVEKEIPIVEPTKRTILLVDDEPIILKTFFSYLCDDYKVLAVNSAKDALNLMNTKIPDLILLDYNMPVTTGGELLEKMRSLTWKPYCNVPVIFVTAVSDKNIIIQCLSQHPQGYLIKPIGKEQLLSTVANFFEKNK